MMKTLVIFAAFYALVYCAADEGKCQGFCMKAHDCPNKPERGFCPNKADVCCYGVSLSEKRCKNRGGDCVDSCPSFLRDTKASNCPTGQFCCIFIN